MRQFSKVCSVSVCEALVFLSYGIFEGVFIGRPYIFAWIPLR
jgi:hypothetical protein